MRFTVRGGLALVALGGLLLPSAASADDHEEQSTMSPPYEEGADAGESWSYRNADTENGRVTIVSSYPVPVPLFCPAQSEVSTLRAVHEPVHRLTEDSVVTIEVEDALVDTYGFVVTKVTDTDGTWYGAEQLRGPVAGGGPATVEELTGEEPGRSGEIDVELVGAPGHDLEDQPELIIEFGLELASACPTAGLGTASFPTVAVTY